MSDYETGVRLRLRFSKQDADALSKLASARATSVTALIHAWLYAELNNSALYEAPNARNNSANPTV
jgi:hypothetical protein